MMKFIARSTLAVCTSIVLFGGCAAHAATSVFRCDTNDKTSPTAAGYYLNWGKKEELDNQFEPALADLTRVIRQCPDLEEAYFWRGGIYAYESRYDLAVADFTSALRLKPEDGLTYGARGSVYMAEGLYGRAISDDTRAIALGGGYKHISLLARGSALLYAGRIAEAVLDLSQSIALKSDNAIAYSTRALAYDAMGSHDLANTDYATALSLLNASIAAQPKEGHWYVQRGLVLERTGDNDEAIANETQALALHTLGPADAYVFRAIAYDHKGLHAEAAADLRSATQIDKFSKLEWNAMKRLSSSSPHRSNGRHILSHRPR